MEINNKELTEMINVLAKQIVSVAKVSFTEYNHTFVSVIQAIGEKNTYTILDEYNVTRKVPMSIPYVSLIIGQRVYVTVPNGDLSKMYISGIYMQTNRGEINEGNITITPDSIGTYNQTQIDNMLANKSPTYHASSETNYGLGTQSLYGHVKIINSLTQQNYIDGTVLSAYQGKVLKELIDTESINRQNVISQLDVDSPSSSGTDIAFIDNISQVDGKIFPTKKTIRNATNLLVGVSKPDNETISIDENGTISVKPITNRTTRSSIDFNDNTDIVSSNNSNNGFDSNETIYRRKALYLWNYIKSKISLLCGAIKVSLDGNLDKDSISSILSTSYHNEDGSILLNSNGIISAIGTDNINSNNPSILFGTEGTTYLASGGCKNTFPSISETYNDDNLYLISDNLIALYPNCTDDSSTYTEPITFYNNSIGGANCNYYGICNTEAIESDKEITVSDNNFKLIIGAVIGVMFSETNTASNITLNVNNTGSKSIYSNGSVVTTGDGGCIADNVSFYMFNGTYWCKMF